MNPSPLPTTTLTRRPQHHPERTPPMPIRQDLTFALPSFDEVRQRPQRSQLAALQISLALAQQALVCSHQELRWTHNPCRDDPSPAELARLLFARARELRFLVDAYRATLDAMPPNHENDPDDSPY